MNGIFITALSSFGGLMVGLALSRRGKEREEYYNDVVRLCSYLISNISFKADKIASVLASAEVRSVALKKNLNEYKAYIEGGEFAMSENCLTKGEAAYVKEFFIRLGRYDGDTQLNELKRCECEFEAKHKDIKTKNDKQGNMYIKLGLLFGLLVGILLI